ncbi:bladder cancer-related protein BC10-domain-containing protein [Chaetomium sp. MPI-SDFR-AT-0129]|nr:bladder cancer-related protein BC10-domain-containing protein [Chaetomium sp. MPI-SDFR-AT-0129]
MFCLRSWLPLLFIPTNASPAFIFLFFLCTYFLNRPCFYCSFLLIILFLTSCNWSDRCFLDLGSNWFQSLPPASYIYLPAVTTPDTEARAAPNNLAASEHGSATATTVAEMLNMTAGTLATAAAERMTGARVEWTGLGLEWLRSLLGRREWRIDCMDLYIRL